MSGVKGRSGGARPGSGPKPGAHANGGRRGALDKSLSPARIIPTADKWNFAEYSLAHAYSMIDILVSIANDVTQPSGVRVMAADKVLDRAVGRAPATIDISTKHHTAIVYQSAEELRAKIRAAIEEEGVPRALLDLQVDPIEEDEDD